MESSRQKQLAELLDPAATGQLISKGKKRYVRTIHEHLTSSRSLEEEVQEVQDEQGTGSSSGNATDSVESIRSVSQPLSSLWNAALCLSH